MELYGDIPSTLPVNNQPILNFRGQDITIAESASPPVDKQARISSGLSKFAFNRPGASKDPPKSESPNIIAPQSKSQETTSGSPQASTPKISNLLAFSSQNRYRILFYFILFYFIIFYILSLI